MILAVLLAQFVTAPAAETARFAAPEARQGVAAGDRHVYVVDNSRIAKYDSATGRRLAQWQGDPEAFAAKLREVLAVS